MYRPKRGMNVYNYIVCSCVHVSMHDVYLVGNNNINSVTWTAFPYHTLHRQPIPITGIAQTVPCTV